MKPRIWQSNSNILKIEITIELVERGNEKRGLEKEKRLVRVCSSMIRLKSYVNNHCCQCGTSKQSNSCLHWHPKQMGPQKKKKKKKNIKHIGICCKLQVVGRTFFCCMYVSTMSIQLVGFGSILKIATGRMMKWEGRG